MGGGFQKATALHLAVLRNQHAATRLLIARGADLNRREFPDNAAPLHFAAVHGDLETIRLLVEAGADIEGRGDDHGVGVLGWATCFDKVRQDVAAYLLDHGATLNVWTAIALDRPDALHDLVSRDNALLGARMSRNQHRRTPLHHAVAKNRPRMVRLLLELGADFVGRARRHRCIRAGDGVAIGHRQVHCRSPARIRRGGRLPGGDEFLGDYREAEAMLRDDPSRIGPDGRDTIALHLAVARKDLPSVRWLLAHGIDVNAKRPMWD